MVFNETYPRTQYLSSSVQCGVRLPAAMLHVRAHEMVE